jgi:hypothetical protein
VNRAVARLGLRDVPGAIEHLEEAQRSAALESPHWRTAHARMLGNLGLCHAMLGDLVKAEGYLEFARAGSPKSNEPFLEYLTFYLALRRGRDAEALERFERHATTIENGLEPKLLRVAYALHAFALWRSGAGDDEVSREIDRARPIPAVSLDNLSADWPAFRGFLASRSLALDRPLASGRLGPAS